LNVWRVWVFKTSYFKHFRDKVIFLAICLKHYLWPRTFGTFTNIFFFFFAKAIKSFQSSPINQVGRWTANKHNFNLGLIPISTFLKDSQEMVWFCNNSTLWCNIFHILTQKRDHGYARCMNLTSMMPVKWFFYLRCDSFVML
jgi:hypothetical protein